MNAYLSNYQQNQIKTATPEQILVMLYDGAIRFISQASEAISQKNHEKKALYINKTTAIIMELKSTLDHKVGGEISANLASLYDFMLRQLSSANLKNDSDKLKVVSNIMSELRDTWVQAIEINRQEKAAAPQESSSARSDASTIVNIAQNA